MTGMSADLSRVEVLGQTIMGIMTAMGEYSSIAKSILRQNSIRSIEPDAWYPMAVCLAAVETIGERVGEHTLFVIGKRVPENVVWPPHIRAIDEVLDFIDIAYHSTHRLDGAVLYDPASGVMKEGIGHYRHQKQGPRRSVMVCDTPFPSEFDRGLILEVARQFKPDAEVSLDDTKPTRKGGALSCTYIVSW
ncbi:MAG TPA: hypothetical protein VE093_30735 [Polyangiaceae bacterium]|nr:hypothetical protein [Polyangiaceae bacterium]